MPQIQLVESGIQLIKTLITDKIHIAFDKPSGGPKKVIIMDTGGIRNIDELKVSPGFLFKLKDDNVVAYDVDLNVNVINDDKENGFYNGTWSRIVVYDRAPQNSVESINFGRGEGLEPLEYDNEFKKPREVVIENKPTDPKAINVYLGTAYRLLAEGNVDLLKISMIDMSKVSLRVQEYDRSVKKIILQDPVVNLRFVDQNHFKIFYGSHEDDIVHEGSFIEIVIEDEPDTELKGKDFAKTNISRIEVFRKGEKIDTRDFTNLDARRIRIRPFKKPYDANSEGFPGLVIKQTPDAGLMVTESSIVMKDL